LALVDGSDRLLAFSSLVGQGGQAEFDRLRRDPGVWAFEREIIPRRQDAPGAREVHGRRLVIGLRTEPAAFIYRAATLHLAAAALGIVSLIGLAAYFQRAWDQLLKLKAREESERSLAGLGRLAATLAHEIRNPLGAIKGLTQVVQEQLPRDDAAREHLSTVVDEAERLEKLVEDLLLFARPREPKLRPVGLLEELNGVRQMMEADLASRGVSIRVTAENGEVRCQSDADGLHQVLLNVLRNAMEASPAGGEISVSVIRSGKFGRIVVDDQGPGLSEEPTTLFEPFKTSKLRGTGLGLSVSKQIVERLGGSIQLENRPDGGARCIISAPV
jgi:two-component system sensor histidine kinase HydH